MAALRSLWRMIDSNDLIYIGDRWESRSISDVIEWAVEQCEMQASSEVVKQLAEFRRVAALERYHYAFIPNLWMGTGLDSFQFHDGTTLAKVGSHPDQNLLAQIAESSFTSLPYERLNLYLGFSAVEKCHFGVRPAMHDNSDSLRLSDIAMCINLSRPVDGAIVLSAFSNFYPGNTPLTLRGYSWSIPFSGKPAMQNGIIEIFLRSADKLYKDFSSCNEEVKARARVAARYLSRMGMVSHLDDQLISLRVALEALFCHPPAKSVADACSASGGRKRRGPTWMVKHRPAMLLGKSKNEQAELKKLFGDVYDVLSTAAHEGRVDKKHDRTKIERVAGLLRDTIRQMIENRTNFDWSKLDDQI